MAGKIFKAIYLGVW